MEPGLQWNDAFLEREYLAFDSRIVYNFIFYILKELFICCIRFAAFAVPFVSFGSETTLRELGSLLSQLRKQSNLPLAEISFLVCSVCLAGRGSRRTKP
jgi:hypothetical protein